MDSSCGTPTLPLVPEPCLKPKFTPDLSKMRHRNRAKPLHFKISIVPSWLDRFISSQAK